MKTTTVLLTALTLALTGCPKPQVELSSLSLSPDSARVARGDSIQFVATAFFTDGEVREVTAEAAWSVDDAFVGSTSPEAPGLIRAEGEGQTVVRARFGEKNVTRRLEVIRAGLVALQLEPPHPVLPVGLGVPVKVIALRSDGSKQDVTEEAVWSWSTPGLATIERSMIVGKAPGTLLLTASVQGLFVSAPVDITAARVEAVEVEPARFALAAGVTRRLTATARLSDGTSMEVTGQAQWASSAPEIASASEAGLITGLATGTAQVTASVSGQSGASEVTVNVVTLTALELSPLTATLPMGVTRGFTAVGTFSDGTTQDLTAQAAFITASSAVATVVMDQQYARVTGRRAGATALFATALGLTAQAELTITPALPMGLSLHPETLTLARGASGPLTVQASWSDGTSTDVTAQAIWSSSEPSLVSVSNAPGNEGMVTGQAVGGSLITARLGALVATSLVTISPAALTAIEVTPTSPVLPLGASERFLATGRYTDGSARPLSDQVTWTSSSPGSVSVSNAAGTQGQGLALAQGASVITASFGGKSGSTTATVTAATLARVQLSPPQPRMAKNTRIALHATGVWTDGGTQDLTAGCTWSSASPSIATVSNAPATRGQVLGLAPGLSNITASCLGQTGVIELAVTDATLVGIDVTPLAPTAAAGFDLALTATGRFSDGTTQPFSDFVTWSSADPSRAMISAAGVVSARAAGAVVISAQALEVVGTVSFVVSAAVLQSIELAPVPALARGLSHDLVALGHFSDGAASAVSQSATWSSSNLAVATISNAIGSRGRVNALSEGVTTITAQVEGFTVSATLTVTPAVLSSLTLTPVAATIAKGLTLQLTATGIFSDSSTRDLTTEATWSSSDGAVVQISNATGSQGTARGMGVGSSSVTAMFGVITGSTTLSVSAAQLTSIGVTPSNGSIPRGLARQLTATGVYTDGSTADLAGQVTWTSSDSALATVAADGTVQTFSTGAVIITATRGSSSGSTGLTITPAVLQQLVLTPPSPSVIAGFTTSLTATGVYSDASTEDLTAQASWSSADLSTATVNGGLVTARAAGSTTVSATLGAVSGQVTLAVTPAVLQQLQLTPQNVSLPRGLEQQFTAMGVFSDGSTAELTSSVTWSSSDASIVVLSNANGSRGLASTPGLGAVEVFATLAGITGSTPFSVSPAVLSGITISPGSSTASLGSVRQFGATGRYTDGTSQNLTAQVSWSSSNAAVASISNANGSHGLTTTLATGVTLIGAAFGSYSAQANLAVIQNALTQIELTPSSGGTALGYSRQFIALGTFSDGTTQVLTSQVTWTTDDPAIAIVSNADGSRGLFSTVGVGSVTVAASAQGISASVVHTVTPAMLVAIALSQPSLSLNVSGSSQLNATGYFSDGSEQDLTSSVTWMSLDPMVAQVSNAAGSAGLVTAIGLGNTAVSATSGAVSASVNLTVN